MRNLAENKMKKLSGFKLLNAVVYTVIAMLICIALLSSWFTGEWADFKSISIDIIFMIIALALGVNIHELGHVVFGKIVGYRLISYSIGPFTWLNENGKMRFSIRKNKGYGGLCSMMPPDKNLSNYQYGMYYAGGIFFNTLSASTLAVTYIALGDLSDKMNSFFLDFIFCWVLLAGFNLLPLILGNNPTDGKLIWSMLIKSPFTEKLICLNRISVQRSSGSRPRDIPITVLPNTEKPDAFDMILVLYLYFKALDSDNQVDILFYSGIIEKNIESFSNISLPAVYNELCFSACIAGDMKKAKAYYNKAENILKNDKDISGFRVKAYYEYYINGSDGEALSCCKNALKLAGKYPSKGQAKMEVSLIEKLQSKISDKLFIQ